MYPYNFYSQDDETLNDSTLEMELQQLPDEHLLKSRQQYKPPLFDPFLGKQPQPPVKHRESDKPTAPPPSYVPKKSGNMLYAVDPQSIRRCVYNYTYVWLSNGRSFWMYLTYAGRRSISGYRWTNFGWAYIGLDLDMIESFYCLPY